MIQGFAMRLKLTRTQKGLKQKQVAELLNTSRSTISSYENGNITPSPEVIMKLAALYSVSTDYLFGIQRERIILTDGLNNEQINCLEQVAAQFRKVSQSIT